MKFTRHITATRIVWATVILVSALAIRFAYAWRVAATATQQSAVAPNRSARDESVLSQPRSFKKAETELERKQVKGAPFSAELTIETSQISRDGTSKPVVLQSFVYRDVEGRMRRAQPDEIATLNDFVAGVSYLLEPSRQMARKRSLEPLKDAPVAPAVDNMFKGDTRYKMLPSQAPQNNTITSPQSATEESLGERLIEGVKAQGTQLTTTIAANTFGNPQPITIVEERWYSPELQTMLLIKYSDQRFGESVYRLTNISRTEPAPALFVVPEKFTIKDETGKPQRAAAH
jgi:hypothetical protein